MTAYTCPKCARSSAHPHDLQERFCSTCGFEDIRALQAQLLSQQDLPPCPWHRSVPCPGVCQYVLPADACFEEEADVLHRITAPVTWQTINGVDVPMHPYGPMEDLLQDAAAEIRALRARLDFANEGRRNASEHDSA